MEKVIITGSNGFIGKNLLNVINDKYDVLEINEDLFNELYWTKSFISTLSNFKPDIIFHVGACSNTLEQDVNYMMTRNYESTRILSDYCFKNNCMMIYSSSAANYGTNNLHPSNLYGWSKYVAEKHVIKNGGIALRYFNVYGPYESEKGKMASVAYQMSLKYKNGEEIKLFPNKPLRDFVYIKDVISANLYALENYEKLKGNFYEVGSGESRTFEDVMNILEIPFTYFEENEIPKGYQFHTQSTPLNWMSDWKPIYNLEKGLKEYKKWINQQ
jgi:ADP-L-glycero-D-manno-heptose 6-epimerase